MDESGQITINPTPQLRALMGGVPLQSAPFEWIPYRFGRHEIWSRNKIPTMISLPKHPKVEPRSSQLPMNDTGRVFCTIWFVFSLFRVPRMACVRNFFKFNFNILIVSLHTQTSYKIIKKKSSNFLSFNFQHLWVPHITNLSSWTLPSIFSTTLRP